MSDTFNVNNKGRRANDVCNTNHDWLNRNAVNITRVYYNHMNYLLNIVTNLYRYDGLPLDPIIKRPIRSSFFESMLALSGNCCIARSDNFGVIASTCTIIGTLNLYGQPNKVKLYSSSNGWTKKFTPGINEIIETGNFAYFRNDNFGKPFYPLVDQTAKMLSTTLFGITCNISQQKFPVILRGTQDTKLTAQHTIAQIDSYQPYILLKNETSFNPEDGKPFNIDLPYVANDMYESYTNILNNFFMQVGINILPNAKKERMIVDEVNSSNQAVRAVSDVYLTNRQEGVDYAKALFPELENLSVVKNNEFITTIEENFDPEKTAYEMKGGA